MKTVTSDIANIAPQERELDIVIPGTSEKIGLKLRLMSLQDDRMKVVRRTIGDKFLARRQRNKAASSVEIQNNQREICMAAVTGWEWGENSKGEQATFRGDQPDFSRKALHEVLTTLEWVVSQIDEFISDEADFFQD